MYRNALEDDLRVRAARLRRALWNHDRGVLIGLAFSIMPIPPVALAGLVISLLNLRLLRSGRLAEDEGRLVRLSIGAALASLVVGLVLFAVVGWLALHFLSVKLPAILDGLRDVFEGQRPTWTPRPGMRDV